MNRILVALVVAAIIAVYLLLGAAEDRCVYDAYGNLDC